MNGPQETLTDLAGTGAWGHLEFMKQVSSCHDRHRAFFDPRTLRRRELLTVPDYERLPAFVFEDPRYEPRVEGVGRCG